MTLSHVLSRIAACGRQPAICLLALAVTLGGCSSLISSVSADFSSSLSTAMLNQSDPALVREAIPAYMLLTDSMIESSPNSAGSLATGAKLYTLYGAVLVNDPERAASLTTKARDYGARALCAAEDNACDLDALNFDEYVQVIESVDDDEVDALYSYSLATLAWIRANSGDYNALAGLPKVEVALERVMEMEPGELAPGVCMYLGILNTLRPEVLGGKPEVGRQWFERGIALSEGRDLSIKVEYARGYARLNYDRELHDRLLNEVLAADVQQPDLTLFNTLAQEEARALLSSADDYF